MHNTLIAFIESIDKVRKDLGRIKTTQLSSKNKINDIRSYITKYFETIRPSLDINKEINKIVIETDNCFQELLVLSHKKTTVTKYIDRLVLIKQKLIQINAQIYSSPLSNDSKMIIDDVDKLILSTLQNLLPSAALSYYQAIIDLKNNERMSWRGPATDLRESLRETSLCVNKVVAFLSNFLLT